MEDISHRKLLSGVIILRKDDRDKVLDFLGSYSLAWQCEGSEINP